MTPAQAGTTGQMKNRQNIAYLIANNTPISHIMQEVDTSIHPAHVSSKLCHYKTKTTVTCGNATYSCNEHQVSVQHVLAGQNSDWHQRSYSQAATTCFLNNMQNIVQIQAKEYRSEI